MKVMQDKLCLNKVLIAAFLSVFLVACGFHLRGNVPLSPNLGPMYVDTKTPYDPVVQAIENALTASHIELTDSPKSANTTLRIIEVKSGENLVSVSASTNTRQYSLTKTVILELIDSKGKTIIPVSSVTASNPLTVDSSQVLNMSSQKQAQDQEMQQALVQQVMLKLGSRNTTKALATL